MKKHLLKSLLVLGLITSMVFSSAVTVFADNKALTKEQINKRITEINEKYEVGDLLSKKDSDFILKHSTIINKRFQSKFRYKY